MGLIGIFIGLATEVVGVIKDDDEMVERGFKRTMRGVATTLIGDVAGVSDSVDILNSTIDSEGYT